MHAIVEYTRAQLRNDRPIHLLGIGGIRDIFHGVRQGIDTFDCVHPTRLGRHGGALVQAAHWDEEVHSGANDVQRAIDAARDAKYAKREKERILSVRAQAIAEQRDPDAAAEAAQASPKHKKVGKKPLSMRTVREHINVTKAPMRADPRPITEGCQCYTCRNYSRSYLHHLFKAKEALGGALVTLHNVHFMNKLMADIRGAIATEGGLGSDRASGKTLAEVERQYVHPELAKTGQDEMNMGA